MRRVVTGTDHDGSSVFASDDEVAPLTVALMPGASVVEVWGVDEPVTLPVDGSPPPGERKLLKAGDSVILNGTRHSWHNESDQPCTMISAVIGAERRA